MALSVFDAAGVMRLHWEAGISSLSDLLVYSLEELEPVAAEKDSIRQLLNEKWTTVYTANSPRGIWSSSELRVA